MDESEVGSLGEEFEGEGVDLAAEIVGEEPVAGMFPTAMAVGEETSHESSLGLEALDNEPLEERVEEEGRYLSKTLLTRDGEFGRRVEEGVVVGPDGIGDKTVEFEGEGLSTVLERDGGVVVVDGMKDDIVVGGIGSMVMTFPVGGADMNLDITDELDAIDKDTGVEEVGAGIAVEGTWSKDNEREAVGRNQRSLEEFMLPDEL